MPKVEVSQIQCEDGLFGVTCIVDGKKKKFWLSPKEVVLNHLAAQQGVQAELATPEPACETCKQYHSFAHVEPRSTPIR